MHVLLLGANVAILFTDVLIYTFELLYDLRIVRYLLLSRRLGLLLGVGLRWHVGWQLVLVVADDLRLGSWGLSAGVSTSGAIDHRHGDVALRSERLLLN